MKLNDDDKLKPIQLRELTGECCVGRVVAELIEGIAGVRSAVEAPLYL
jgi:hypothetical protein